MRDPFATFDRTSGVGASEVAAVMGMSPYRDALDVWLAKTRSPAWRPPKATPAMEWGNRLEAVVLAKYQDDTGRTVHTGPMPGLSGIEHDGVVTYRHWSVPLFVTLDGWLGPRSIIEAKTASDPAAWAEGVPVHYVLQAQAQMLVVGAVSCVVVVLIRGHDYRSYTLDADLSWQERIEEAVARFWSLVESRTPPVVVTDPAILYPTSDDSLAPVAGAPYLAQVALVRDLRAQMAELAGREREAVDDLKRAIGEAPGMTGPGFRIDYRERRAPTVVGWEYVAAGLEKVLGNLRDVEGMPPEAARWLDPGIWEVLTSLYTVAGKPVRPFYLRDTEVTSDET